MQKRQFDHEKLNAYQRSLDFITWVDPILESIQGKLSAKDQLDRASTSMPLNIAEGNGRYTEKDRCHFFDIARGSALECAAALDVLRARRRITQETVAEGKGILTQVVPLLVGLIKSNSGFRVHEDRPEYGSAGQD